MIGTDWLNWDRKLEPIGWLDHSVNSVTGEPAYTLLLDCVLCSFSARLVSWASRADRLLSQLGCWRASTQAWLAHGLLGGLTGLSGGQPPCPTAMPFAVLGLCRGHRGPGQHAGDHPARGQDGGRGVRGQLQGALALFTLIGCLLGSATVLCSGGHLDSYKARWLT